VLGLARGILEKKTIWKKKKIKNKLKI